MKSILMLGGILFAVGVFIVGSDATARNRFKTKPKVKLQAVEKEPGKAREIKSIQQQVPTPDRKNFKLNTLLGIHIVESSAIVVGGQLGVPVTEDASFYLGPEVSFSLYSPSSILYLMGGGWKEIGIDSTSTLAVAFGAFFGMAVPSGLAFLSGNTYAVFADLVLAQALDEYVSVRGQLRPGWVGGSFAVMMNFNVSFRL